MYLFEVQLSGQSMSPAVAQALAADIGAESLKFSINSETGEPHGWLDYSTPSALMTTEQLARWSAKLGGLSVARAKNVGGGASGLAEVAAYGGERRTGPEFNTKVNVAVGGLGLLQIDEVQLEADCCTDYLNKCLADGWRILAVCVQPDQRRPDYILGRVSQP
jgi:hypothetical protein